MGYQYSAYHFYGAYVPEAQWNESHPYDEGDRLSRVIKEQALGNKAVSLGYLTAGDYDRDMLFLVLSVRDVDLEVSLGEFRMSPTIPDITNWQQALRVLADAAGYRNLTYGWYTVPDLS